MEASGEYMFFPDMPPAIFIWPSITFRAGKGGIEITPAKFIPNAHWLYWDILPSRTGPGERPTVEDVAHPPGDPLHRVPSMTKKSFGCGTPAARKLRAAFFGQNIGPSERG